MRKKIEIFIHLDCFDRPIGDCKHLKIRIQSEKKERVRYGKYLN